MQIMVALDAVQELLSALRVPDVLNANIDTLLDITVTNDLVDDNADSVWGDIVDDTGPAEYRHSSSNGDL